MPRANRYFLPGYIWHITHRCHKREFLLPFSRDKKRWLYWFFEAKKRVNSLLTYFFLSCLIACCSQKLELDELKKNAFILYKEGKYRESIKKTKKALSQAEHTYGNESIEAAEFIGNLSALYRIIGKTKKGEELKLRAKEIRDMHGVSGVPLGIQTEAFFERIIQHRRRVAENDTDNSKQTFQK